MSIIYLSDIKCHKNLRITALLKVLQLFLMEVPKGPRMKRFADHIHFD
jgi:hypothetical protein